jgi:hypothetical protein
VGCAVDVDLYAETVVLVGLDGVPFGDLRRSDSMKLLQQVTSDDVSNT